MAEQESAGRAGTGRRRAGGRTAARGDEKGGTREAILDATEAIMAEESYSAVTSRRVAERAGLKSQLVHYYFRTMDDLFVAVYERSEKRFLERHLRAVSSENPLRALWEISIHPERTRLAQEFIALSNQNESIRKISARILDHTYRANSVFIAKYLAEAGVDPERFPPVVIAHLIHAVSRDLVNDQTLGVSHGHEEIHAFVERLLDAAEASRQTSTGGRKAERGSKLPAG